MNFHNPINYFKGNSYYQKGLRFLRNSDNLKAIACFRKSLEYFDGNADFKKYFGIAYLRNQQLQEGKKYLLEAEKMHLTGIKCAYESELFYYLGLIYDAEIDLRKAKEYYQLAIKKYKKADAFTNTDYIRSRLIKIDKWFRNLGEAGDDIQLKLKKPESIDISLDESANKTFESIKIKYESFSFSFDDVIDVDDEIVYIPDWNEMIYNIHDNVYDHFKFKPGDTLTVKAVKVSRIYNPVLVKENNYIFIPAEFIPKALVDERDIMLVKEVFEKMYQEEKK